MQRHCGQPCRRDFITCGASVAHVSVAHSNGTQQPFCRRHFLGSLGAAWAASSFPVTASSSSAALPSVQLAPGLEISRVIKGCWQLSGGHRGDKNSDRTGGRGAIEDFRSFIEAGINTFDTADIYGPSEKLIGNFLSTCSPEEKQNCHVLTKFCCFGDSMRQARNKEFVRKVM